MKKYCLAFASLLLCLTSRAERTALVSWQFSKDGSSWETVTIPHSVNAADGRSSHYYRGKSMYRRTVSLGEGPDFLLLEGAAQAAEVYLDGALVRSHKGGYTPFVVRLDGEGEHELMVVCDNTEDIELIPVSSDFNKNGGLHNPAWLLSYGDFYFCPAEFGPYRMHVVQKDVSADRAVIEVRAGLRNAGTKPIGRDVLVEVRDAGGRLVTSAKQKVRIPSSGASFSATLVLDKPHLWDGKDDPYLYTVSVSADGDKAETKTGLRFFSIDADKGFSLNGRPCPLRGVSMHQDMEGRASALSKADFDRDYAIVEELGCNFLRLAHYPHNDYAFRLCDSLGIIVQTEIPWVNVCGVNATDAYLGNIRSQMGEMVRSLFNHPSIAFWGMWNELDTWGNNDGFQGPLDAGRVVSETAALYDYAKSLDPSRFVGVTDCTVYGRDGYESLKADYFSENRYHGWYYNYGDFSGITPEMESIRDRLGPANISEYGVGINPFCHSSDPLAIRRDASDSLHFEAYGNRSHEAHAQQIARMPWLGFTSLWILFDFPVANRREGFMNSSDGVNFVVDEGRKYTNDKGLVTRDRSVFKDVFYLYKSWWNKSVETVYITERRLKYRPEGQEFTLTVYSNAPALTLYRDGEKISRLESSGEETGVVWKFEGVRMGKGDNVFRVVSDSGASDFVVWSSPLPQPVRRGSMSPEAVQAYLRSLRPDPEGHRLSPDPTAARNTPYRGHKNFGKSVAVFGGSLSVNKESDAAKQLWADLLGAEVVTYGVGGAGFSRDQGYTVQRQVDTAGVYDVYVLWASTNDYTNSRECGSWSDYTVYDGYDVSKLSTQCGGINYCIRKLLEKNPSAEIYFFTSLRFFGQDADHNPFSDAPNATGKTFSDYIKAQKECCEHFGIPVLDQFNFQGINEFNFSEFYLGDKLHMNEDGYRRIGPVQASFLADGR